MRTLPTAIGLFFVFVGFSACGGASNEARHARGLLANGDFSGAQRAADDGLSARPRDGDLWRIKMRALLAGGNASAAVTAYDKWRGLRGHDDPVALREMAVTTLWQGLQTPAATLKAQAIVAIERHAIESLAMDVADLVSSDSDQVAAAAATATVSAHPQAPRVLIDLLASDDPVARAIAVAGIGRRVGEYARDDLLPMLSDKDPRVRRAALGAVARFLTADEIEPIEKMASDDKDGSVRARAIAVVANKRPRGHIELARKALVHEYLGVRLAAVQLLERDHSQPAIALLAELAAGDDSRLALSAAVAILRHEGGSEAATHILEQAIKGPSWSERAAAVNAAGGVPRPLALQLAGRAIVDPRAEVRLAAARLLMQLGGDQRARTELQAALQSPDAQVRIDAAADLLRLGDNGEGAEALAALSGHRSSDIRRAAIMAHNSARRITPGLVTALADPKPELRLAAADLIIDLL